MDYTAQKAAKAFQQQNNISLNDMLNPITVDTPAGLNLRDSEVYQRIQEARQEDDSSTPRGVWEFDMRRADWDTVYTLSVNAISQQSKDIQLAVWMMEAQLMRVGFASIAPSVQLIIRLCQRYWDQAYPQIEDGDSDHRGNIISWVNNKLSILVKQIPITDRPDTDTQYGWSDWEMALRNAQMLNAHPESKDLEQEVSVETIVLNINQTAIEFYQHLYDDLELALESIDQLIGLLDDHLGKDSPSLGVLSGVLEEIAGLAHHQLDQRGLLPNDRLGPDESGGALTYAMGESPAEITMDSDARAQKGGERDTVQNRNDAYTALRNIADYLALDDPHSPTPYLIYKAVEWGKMNTGQLYRELFVEQQGQLNIFEMLGIEATEHHS